MPHRVGRRVILTAWDVDLWNERWPCSAVQVRPQFFDFDPNGDLVDTSITESEEGDGAALALSHDAQAWEPGKPWPPPLHPEEPDGPAE